MIEKWREVSILAGCLALVMMVYVTTASAQVVTVDNTDPGFTILSGNWNTGAFPVPNGADYRWAETTDFDPSEPYAEVEWRPNLPISSLYEVTTWYVQGTNRATNAVFNVHHNGGSTPVVVNQQINGGAWHPLGTFDFAAGTTGHVTLDHVAAPNVVIADAVRFTAVGGETVELTMAISPANGTTTPAAGGPYTQLLGENVAITAAAAPGYVFDHWETSAGLLPTAPTSASTTVTMDQSKTVTAVFAEGSNAPSFRGFWADAFHPGYKSIAQVDQMIALAIAGNYNAIIPEVLAFHDNVGNGHGAYWDSDIIPRASDISGPFDPLAYMVQQAHAAGLEVHCWLVAFRVSSSWPPSGNPTMTAHPEWIMVPSGSLGGGPATVDGYYTLDPGSPDVQAYLASIVSELVNNYDIDGIHWDYIRYTNTNAGYPADASYNNSGLKRFQRLTGRADVPPSTGDAQWNDFRRRSITEIMRSAMTDTATADNPRQPLRHTAALITWGNAPASFTSSSAYNIFQDWRMWMEFGYLDAGIPMTYYREWNPPHDDWYRNWVDASIGWRYDRHLFTGPGIYLNSFAQSVTQMQYALNAGADGLSSYSYNVTSNTGSTWTDWYPYVASNIFTAPVAPPAMPWRDPAQATEGYIHGKVTDGVTGHPIDDAAILLGGVDSGIRTDGNGRFLLTHVPAAGGGTAVAVGASATGYADVERPAVLATPAGFTECNLALGGWLFGDYDVDGDVDEADYDHFGDCLTGPNNGPPPPGCDLFDADNDNDVDLEDAGEFAESVGG